MTNARYDELMQDETAHLTADELADDWHFCVEWGGLLVNPSMPEWWSGRIPVSIPPTPCCCGYCYHRLLQDQLHSLYEL